MLTTPQFTDRFQRYAPEMEKRLRRDWRPPSGFSSWHLDETYIKVNARSILLLTAKAVPLIFYLSPRRDSKAAYRFLGKILNKMKGGQKPRLINTYKAPT